MKTFFILCCTLFAAAMVAGQKREDVVRLYADKFQESFDTCAKEANMKIEDVLDNLLKKKNIDKTSCFVACTMKREGMMKDGKIDQDSMKKIVTDVHADTPDLVQRMVDANVECFDQSKNESDECKVAMKHVECFLGKVTS